MLDGFYLVAGRTVAVFAQCPSTERHLVLEALLTEAGCMPNDVGGGETMIVSERAIAFPSASVVCSANSTPVTPSTTVSLLRRGRTR